MGSPGLEGGVKGRSVQFGEVSLGVLALQTGLVFAVLVPKVVSGDERPLEGFRVIIVGR